MTDTDEIARLAQADPVPAGSLDPVPAPPAPEPAPRRSRRVVGAAATGAGVLALGGLIAALIISAPSDEPGEATFDGTLRVSLLDSPQGPEDRLPVAGPPFDPAALRLGIRDGGWDYFVATRRDDGRTCLLSAQARRFVVQACGRLSQGLIADVRPRDGAKGIVGLVPDGIETVTIGRATAQVRDNLFVLTASGSGTDFAVLRGPAAAAVTPSGGAVVAVPSSDPTPTVGVAVEPSRSSTHGLPLPVDSTPEEAAAAVAFTVLLPDPPPLPGDRWVQHTAPDPRVVPTVTVTYLPATPGAGITLIESAPFGRAGVQTGEEAVVRDGRTYYVRGRDDPARRQLRVTAEGTEVRIAGRDATLDELIAVAASLRPVG